MTYLIQNLSKCPWREINAHAFGISLSPQWREQVAASKLTQHYINGLLQMSGNDWLDSAGYNAMFDPDNCGADRDPARPLGPRSHRLYDVQRGAIRVDWGEWGPHQITIPGNACGLDITDCPLGSAFPDGRLLAPHNIDSLAQKYLFLIVFTELANAIYWATP